jgi:hypothetical protein
MQPPRVATTPCTLGDVLRFLGAEAIPPDWPPDVFGTVALILQRSGAYTQVVREWPPTAPDKPPDKQRADWTRHMREVGTKWRQTAVDREPPPDPIPTWWSTVTAASFTAIDSVASNKPLREALFQLCAAADEACYGVGIPNQPADRQTDAFEVAANFDLVITGSLCRCIDRSRVRVLPKLHSPRSGMTLRSLTHNLSLHVSQEVVPEWRIFPGGPKENRGLNLLLLPWPLEVLPDQFRELRGPLANMPGRFGFFGYFPNAFATNWLKSAVATYEAAEQIVGTVHGVVLPELALTERAYGALCRRYCSQGAFVISGIGEPVADATDASRAYAQNYLRFTVPMKARATGVTRQDKHHRWKMERSQILQYGCGANLSHVREWWEYIELGKRSISFASLNPWLTIAALICEDLARQDPAAELIRAVGPNLVIAILMDGPQLASRWSARYATVFADDPGCSVLTLTSLGMATLSRPTGKPESRVVALWKDALTPGPIEIELPKGADGIVLTLSNEFREEWTADGRSDDESTGYPILAGVHPVFHERRSSERAFSKSRRRE